MIVFPSSTFKYFNETLGLEVDQRVTIRFLHDERANVHNVAQGFHAKLAQLAYAL
jgi:hypothetical protein